MQNYFIVFLLIIHIGITCENSFCQITFQKRYGQIGADDFSGLLQTADSGYLICGSFQYSFSYYPDLYLVKTNANGDTLWTRAFGGNESEYGNSIIETGDGNYLLAGTTKSFGAIYNDIYLIKFNPSGDTLWSKIYGGTYNDGPGSMINTADGGFIISGNTMSYGEGNDTYLLKLNSDGDVEWSKTYGRSTEGNIGTCIRQTIDNGYIIVGAQSYCTGPAEDIILIKTDSMGDTLWTRCFGGTNTDIGSSILQVSDGGFIISGYTRSFGAGKFDACLIKTNSNGVPIWTKTFGGTEDDYGNSVYETSDGGYVIGGMTNSFSANFSAANIFLVKTDINGNLLWVNSYGSSNDDRGGFVQQSKEGGYIITGSEYDPILYYDAYLIKTDSNGNSDCNQTACTPITTTPTLILSSFSPKISSGDSSSRPATQLRSGSIINAICSNVGVNELQNKIEIKVFPNPAKEEINIYIEGEENKTYLARVYNPTGIKITEQRFTKQTKISTSGFSKGIYHVQVCGSDNKSCHTEDIVIQ